MEDEELASLLKAVGCITAEEEFQRWRASFLSRLDEFHSNQEGIEAALRANAAILETSLSFNRIVKKVHACVEEGAISKQHKITVRGQSAANRLKEGCIDNERRLQSFVPGSSAEIKACKHNKFQVGALLVKDGFEVCGHLMWQFATSQKLKVDTLKEVVDRQIVDAITHCQRQTQSPMDVMADLGSFTVTSKMREFAGDTDFASRTKSPQSQM